MTRTDPAYASSLANGLAVLEAFRDRPRGMANQEVAARTGLSPASVSRIAETLAACGLLRFDPATRLHHPDGGALTLAHPLLANLGVRRLARLAMRQTADALGGTVSLGMRERAQVVYVETSRGNDLVDFRPDVGARLPLLRSAIGRAWLAGAGDAERAEALRDLEGTMPAPDREAVAAQARSDLRSKGYCASRGDFRADVHAVAVPLEAVLGGERLVLNCGIPTRRLAPGFLDGVAGPRLARLARRIDADWRAEASARPEPPARPGPAPAPRETCDAASARTLARGIGLLQCFAPGEVALGNGEFARRLGLSGPTVARLTHTLTSLGYLRRDAGGRYPKHRLGAATVAAAYPMLAGLRLRELARPVLARLAERVRGAASLGIRHRHGLVYVENAWRTDARLIPPDTGTRMPMLASAMGRAWLAGAAPAERDAALNLVRIHDPAQWAAHASSALRSLEGFGRAGYCHSRDVRPDVEALGMPLARAVDGLLYAVNVGVLAPKPLQPARLRAVASALADAVAEIDAHLDALSG